MATNYFPGSLYSKLSRERREKAAAQKAEAEKPSIEEGGNALPVDASKVPPTAKRK